MTPAKLLVAMLWGMAVWLVGCHTDFHIVETTLKECGYDRKVTFLGSPGDLADTCEELDDYYFKGTKYLLLSEYGRQILERRKCR